ncbi:hypothetical protein, partial [Hungatella sp.]|uniref:hypothetical protein n=1 Tax=Hungatella sp. TaxID=2613924 RepID=UPI003AB81235
MGIFDFFKQRNSAKMEYTAPSLDKSKSEVKIPVTNENKKNKIPLKVSDFREEHYKVLRRLNNKPIEERLSGIITKEVDIEKFIPVLLENELLRVGTYTECLNLLSADKLRSILKNQNKKS